MSNGLVRAAIEKMEAWLADPAWEPDSDALARWDQEFQAALGQAEKGPGWADLLSRAHLAGQRLEGRIAILSQDLDLVRAELATRDRGNRALKGYGASSR